MVSRFEQERERPASFEKVLRQFSSQAQAAQLLDKPFVAAYPSLHPEQVKNRINKVLLLTARTFEKSEDQDGDPSRIFSDEPLEKQAEGVGVILKTAYTPLSSTVKPAHQLDSATTRNLFQDILQASKAFFEPKDKDDIIGYPPAQLSKPQKERLQKSIENKRLFNEILGISYNFYTADFAWFPHILQYRKGDELETVLQLAQHFFSYRIDALKPQGITENQIIGIGALSLEDADLLCTRIRLQLRDLERENRQKGPREKRITVLPHIIKALYDDPRIGESEDEEIVKIVSNSLPLDTFYYVDPATEDPTSEAYINWDKMAEIMQEADRGEDIYGVSLLYKEDLVKFAQTGELEPARKVKLYEAIVQDLIKREAELMEDLRNRYKEGSLLTSSLFKDEEHMKQKTDPESSGILSARYTNERLIFEIGKYLFEQMLRENKEQHKEGAKISDWNWFEWSHTQIESAFRTAFLITTKLQKRI